MLCSKPFENLRGTFVYFQVLAKEKKNTGVLSVWATKDRESHILSWSYSRLRYSENQSVYSSRRISSQGKDWRHYCVSSKLHFLQRCGSKGFRRRIFRQKLSLLWRSH